MRKYLFGTGLISAITSGLTLLRALRSDEPFTWRTALAWLSWGISLALAIGALVDTRRASRGHPIPDDSKISGKEAKLLRKRINR
jgi:hypothetical protein